MPTAYIPHGGGPCFFMEWDPPGTWDALGAWLKGWSASLPKKPKAILVISAHWEEEEFTVATHPHPHLIYDYRGFPPHTYELTYPAPGSPELAVRVADVLKVANIAALQDPERGFDHGVFIPFKLIYPEADIPIVQLSLKTGLDPEEHIAVGRALAPLRDENVLIVGSGMSYHNIREFFKGGPTIPAHSQAFDGWLKHTVDGSKADARNEGLKDWLHAPSARQAHPREEHLLPLMVVSGAAEEERGRRVFSGDITGAAISAYQFG